MNIICRYEHHYQPRVKLHQLGNKATTTGRYPRITITNQLNQPIHHNSPVRNPSCCNAVCHVAATSSEVNNDDRHRDCTQCMAGSPRTIPGIIQNCLSLTILLFVFLLFCLVKILMAILFWLGQYGTGPMSKNQYYIGVKIGEIVVFNELVVTIRIGKHVVAYRLQ